VIGKVEEGWVVLRWDGMLRGKGVCLLVADCTEGVCCRGNKGEIGREGQQPGYILTITDGITARLFISVNSFESIFSYDLWAYKYLCTCAYK
jgi:hypothetical protein